MRKRRFCWRFPDVVALNWSQVWLFYKGPLSRRRWRIHFNQAQVFLRETRYYNKVCRSIHAWGEWVSRARMENNSHYEGLNVNRQWPPERLLGRGNGDSKLPSKQAPNKKQNYGEVISKKSWIGQRQNLQHIRLFGSLALSNIPAKKKTEFDYQKVWQGILVGYSPDTRKHFRIWAIQTKQIVIANELYIDKSERGAKLLA